MTYRDYIERIKRLNKYYDIGKITRAYQFGEMAHQGQLRKSGEDYFIHPIHVSIILAELELDEDTIIAALLHDVVEDTSITLKDVELLFGKDVMVLVDGVTKLTKMSFLSKEERQVENIRKMFMAMAKDIRVILIKLADRLHNIRTLEYQTPQKKQEKAKETLEIYSPIANRLGIFKMKWELEDLSLKFLDPEGYDELVNKVKKKRSERESIINGYIDQLQDEIDDLSLKSEIYGRPKSFYSIYRKMKYQMKEFEEIYDLTAIRVIVDDVKDCYSVLGIVHTLWKPIPGRFKDYIAMPKSNMYQSLHTTVMGSDGEPFEIQIRTVEMHEVSEYGIAAHWKYKEGGNKQNNNMENRLTWLRQMMEWQSDMDSSEFMKSLKIDIFNTEVFVFTPNGEVIELPVGSTPVDFAYKIHSAVGNRCIGAKVDGRIVPLNFQLTNGVRVDILTSKTASGPSRDWLKFVKSSQAKTKIKQWFKKERKEENIEKGKDMLDRDLRKNNFKPKAILQADFMEHVLKRLSCNTLDDLYAAIGYGGILLSQVTPKIRELQREEEKKSKPQTTEEHIEEMNRPVRDKKKKSDQGVTVKGVEDVLIRFAKCCSPVPGDDIIGYITRGRGITVHRSDCTNFEKSEDSKNRFIEVEWTKEEKSSYSTEIQIIAPDRKGLLSEITILISENDLFVTGVNAKISKNNIAIIHLNIEISDINQLNKLINKLKSMPEIIEVKRVGA